MLRFANPWWLLGLGLIPLYLLYQFKWSRSRKLRFPFNRLDLLRRIQGKGKLWESLFPILKALILTCLVLAIAQPRWGRGERDISRKGVDIILAVDISGSMLAVDFAPNNRLGAAVSVAKDFIKNRPNDRFGLVAFSEYALTQSPLTFDHPAMLEQLGKLQVNEDASGTAIGMGLAKAVARLKDSDAKSKTVILITDGVSNTGEIDPISAAKMAKAFGIKVYPIGVGRGGYVDFPMVDPLFGTFYQKALVELDMETLNEVAAITGTGKAARAGDESQLQAIMQQIDRLEKTEYNLQIRYVWEEKFPLLLWIAFILLVLELALRLWLLPILPEN